MLKYQAKLSWDPDPCVYVVYIGHSHSTDGVTQACDLSRNIGCGHTLLHV